MASGLGHCRFTDTLYIITQVNFQIITVVSAIVREETAESALGKSLGMLKVRLEGCIGVSQV